MVTTERDLLMLSQRLMLMLTMVSMDTHMLLDMPDMPMELTHMPMVLTTERDLLMLSQRLMLTMDTTDMPDLMPMVTDHMDTQLMVTTERDLLMLSQRLMLMLSMESTDTLPTDHMPIVPTDHMLTPPEADADAFYGVYGYSAYRPYAYSAYRPYAYTTRWGYGKRSADAEAEADPALVYTSAVPAVHSVVSSPLVSALTPAATLKTVHTPVTYTHAVAAPAVTYAGVHAVHTPVVNTVGSTVYYGKREAEADPALLYTNAVPAVHSVVGTHAVVGSPLVHHTYAAPTVAKTVVPAVTVAKAADHGVVGTYAGLVHSSHAGICLNNVGVQ